MKQQVKISKVKGNPSNPRIIKNDKFKKLVKSIQEFPEMLKLRPIVVDEDFMVLGGNIRLKASKEAGLSEVWIDIAEGLTEEQKKEFIVKDNVGFGEWEWDILANEWDSVQLAEWGLDVWENEDDKEPEAGLIEDDEIPEVKESIVKRGDIWQLGEHRVMCGDSTSSDDVEKLMNGEKADMVFTSPPYNGDTQVGFKQNKKGGMKTANLYINNKSDNKTSDEYLEFNSKIFNNIKTIAADDLIILYNINYNRKSPDNYIDVINEGRKVFSLVETIIWEKSMAISLAGNNLTRIFEFIFLFYNGKDKPKMNKKHTNECIKNLWKISNIGANSKTHKACFPIKLAEQAITIYAKENAFLYEPFLGSGSTLIAAEKLNRKCYGMELDEKYCDVIINRWEQFTGLKAIHEKWIPSKHN